jgi:uncharacterized phage-associated protein
MNLRFQHKRATQAAARLLFRRGGRMSYMKLLKLMYLADRKALLQFGRPITYDRYVSMDHGPVLSQTYNLMVAEESPTGAPSYWRELISEPIKYEVSLRVAQPPHDQLSPAQESVLDDVFDEFGAMSRWELVSLVHTLPEWQDPQGSSVPISLRDLLAGAGVDDADVDEIEAALLGEEAMAALLDA